MRAFPRSLSVAVLLSLLTACTTVTSTSDDATRGAPRAAIRVEVSADGRPSLYGETLTVPKLARQLKREGSGRAVALHGAEGCTRASLVHIQRELAKSGVPNVSIVTARHATAEVIEDTDGLPGEPQTVAPSAGPTTPRIRRR
jgi:biopolymer transport protein ExbD